MAKILAIDNKTLPISENKNGVDVYLSMQLMRIDEIVSNLFIYMHSFFIITA